MSSTPVPLKSHYARGAMHVKSVESSNVFPLVSCVLIRRGGASSGVCLVILPWFKITSYQVIYSQFGLAIHQNDHQANRRFGEWAQNEIAIVPDFHKQILLSDEAHFLLNGYVNKQNCRIWSEANPQVYVETPLHPEKLTVWCALWAGGILLRKR
ncbi:transposable element Tc3 transposase [Trichonephila clavipes]|nr:transposable element Tc3 transposase [Trichonephila clavipes]